MPPQPPPQSWRPWDAVQRLEGEGGGEGEVGVYVILFVVYEGRSYFVLIDEDCEVRCKEGT